MSEPTQRSVRSVEAIPLVLKEHHHWVLWKWVWREPGKWVKPPFQTNSSYASSTNSRTWTTFDKAWEAYQSNEDWNGIGFVLTQDAGIVGFDIDHLGGEESAEADQVTTIVQTLNSYTEVSPSGNGLRILAIGKLPPSKRRKGCYEVYDLGRYLTITGDHVEETPLSIEPRQAEIEQVYELIFGSEELPSYTVKEGEESVDPYGRVGLGDDELLHKIRTSKDSPLFFSLWKRGRPEKHYDSTSEAVWALLCRLAFWTAKDEDQMERLFLRSPLAATEKFRKRGRPFLRQEIRRAIKAQHTCYTAKGDFGHHSEDLFD